MSSSVVCAWDIDTIFFEILKDLKHSGIETAPRGAKVKELLNYHIVLADPVKSIIKNPARKLNIDYIKKEIAWYLSGTNTIEHIKDHAAMWSKIANEKGQVNSAYGWQIFTQPTPTHHSQWFWILATLQKDKDSRQAVININQVMHKYETKDFPCTLSVQYLIRNNKLNCITTMRSNDIIFGFGNDIPFFTYLQWLLHVELKKTYPDLELGNYCHNVGSMHIYEMHYEMMDKCIEWGSKKLGDKTVSGSVIEVMHETKID